MYINELGSSHAFSVVRRVLLSRASLAKLGTNQTSETSPANFCGVEEGVLPWDNSGQDFAMKCVWASFEEVVATIWSARAPKLANDLHCDWPQVAENLHRNLNPLTVAAVAELTRYP